MPENTNFYPFSNFLNETSKIKNSEKRVAVNNKKMWKI